MERIKRFWRDERATAFLEFATLIGLIVAASIGTVQLAGQWAGGQGAFFHAALP